MIQDEITVMDGGKCIYQLRGVRPFLSDKFDITKHKNYKLLEDYDKKNLFDVEEYLTNRDKVKLKSSYKINRLNIWIEIWEYQDVITIAQLSYIWYNKSETMMDI